MKSFKDYLTESKKTYSFKIKVAGDLPEKFESKLKSALEKWSVVEMSKSTTPVQKVPLDFPEKENMEVHIFEVTLEYPVTDQILHPFIAEKTEIFSSCLKVRNANDPLEDYSKEPDSKYTVKLTSELENPHPDTQKSVGEQGKLNFLSSISKDRPAMEPYKGVNDAILAKNMPSEKAQTVKTDEKAAHSVLGNKKMPDPKGTRK
jgi:hypothetical protein